MVSQIWPEALRQEHHLTASLSTAPNEAKTKQIVVQTVQKSQISWTIFRVIFSVSLHFHMYQFE